MALLRNTLEITLKMLPAANVRPKTNKITRKMENLKTNPANVEIIVTQTLFYTIYIPIMNAMKLYSLQLFGFIPFLYKALNIEN